jgi:hypothetical protein
VNVTDGEQLSTTVLVQYNLWAQYRTHTVQTELPSARQCIEPANDHGVYTHPRHLVFEVKRRGKLAPGSCEQGPNRYEN